MVGAVVEGPAGTVISTLENGRLRFRPNRAGAYTVQVPGTPPVAQIAVNVVAQESDVRVGPSLSETAAQVDPDRFMNRFFLHNWLVWLVVAVALFQGVLGLRRAIQTSEVAHGV
jgi:hypothetical protein